LILNTTTRDTTRELLSHPVAAALDPEKVDTLRAAIATAGLGTGALPATEHQTLSTSAAHGEAELRRLLQDDKATGDNRCRIAGP